MKWFGQGHIIGILLLLCFFELVGHDGDVQVDDDGEIDGDSSDSSDSSGSSGVDSVECTQA